VRQIPRKTLILILAVLMMLVGGAANATTYVCDVKGAYEIKNGKVIVSKFGPTELITWTKVVFDDVSGLFKYGNDRYWKEEKMQVTAKGTKGWSATGHYFHNGSIFSAIAIYSWREPIEFQWLGGGNSDILTGTCKHFGKLE
jgi:hypothetical protein